MPLVRRGAPRSADYLVGTADASLSAEIAVGTAPGGELGGTWASPTVDASHSGSTHAATQAAAEATAASALTTHEGAADPHTVYLKETDFDDIDFLVGTATGFTAVEIVVGTSPGGELGGTWASPTVDASHSGSTHAATQAAAEATAAGALTTHEGASDPHTVYVREADASWIDLTDGGATTLHSHAGGAGATGGTATLDFGAFPGATDASIAVTGQTNIVAGSLAEAWLRPIATADHSADEHMVEAIHVFAADILAGTGFTIHGRSTSQFGDSTRLYGTWNVAWTWQ